MKYTKVKMHVEVKNVPKNTPMAAWTILEKDYVDLVMIVPTSTKQLSIEVDMQNRHLRKIWGNKCHPGGDEPVKNASSHNTKSNKLSYSRSWKCHTKKNIEEVVKLVVSFLDKSKEHNFFKAMRIWNVTTVSFEKKSEDSVITHITCNLWWKYFGTNDTLKVHNNQNHNKNVNNSESECEEITKIKSKEVKPNEGERGNKKN